MLNFQKDRWFVVGKVYVCPYSATLKLKQFLGCSWMLLFNQLKTCSSTLVLASAGKKTEHLEERELNNLYCLLWLFLVVLLLVSEDVGWVGGPVMWPRTPLHSHFLKECSSGSQTCPRMVLMSITRIPALPARDWITQDGRCQVWMGPMCHFCDIAVWHVIAAHKQLIHSQALQTLPFVWGSEEWFYLGEAAVF